ncbi:MAG TPA: DUF1786 domain-containing protein [Candidatus Limnocylindria bacterium]|nr:DUF1786 domain-containing protein [Candidatus Limnocylindria bacterium]
MDERILAIDIGAGTMDVLLHDPTQPMENAIQLVLPSATAIVGRRIESARRAGRPVFLHGNLMGGYHTTNAVWRHLEAGLAVYATERSARTVHDDLDLLRMRGVQIVDEPPAGAVPVELHDLDLARLAKALGPYDVTLPATIAVAAQDHGFSPKASNRLFRFEHWRRFLVPGGTLADHIWTRPPEYMTRLRAIQDDAPGAIVADTGPVAVLGALEDERVAAEATRGVCIVNVGNQHTLGLLVRGQELFGVVEHHTESMTTEKLERLISRLVAGTITHDEVFDDGGHGALVLDAYRENGTFAFVAVTGPNRAMAKPLGWYFAAPHGAMMLSGCFGLVRGVRARLGQMKDPAEAGSFERLPDRSVT